MPQEEGTSELEEVEKELAAQKGKPAVVSAKGRERPISPGAFISPIFLQAFTLTFLAEWGDRSQVRLCWHPSWAARCLRGAALGAQPPAEVWPHCQHLAGTPWQSLHAAVLRTGGHKD